ncbi:MAG: 5-oxoprolinase subunit PxpA [Propioniciclava sp.]|uniref:LamB/YcsF family protein n=1 Tax=Propioniciclava sp. TaxID=2038686 RepID=UPI0039E6958B
MRCIDLSADLGESFGDYTIGNDEALLPLLTSANVACGFHAGDPRVLDRTVRACAERGVEIGAHPGFHDLVGFGRRPISMSTEEVATDTLYQIGALAAFARKHGRTLQHITPHGSLGNLCVADPAYARGVLDAVEAFDPTLPVVTQAGVLADLAHERGIPVAITAMADRAYNTDGSLVSRKLPGAVIHDPGLMVERVLRMVLEGTVEAIDGTVIDLDCHTVLIHGDSPEALEVADRIRTELVAHGVTLAPIPTVLSTRKG